MDDEREKLAIIAEEIEKAVRQRIRETYSPRAVAYIEKPVNVGVVERANGFGVFTGLCGDTMKIYLRMGEDVVREATFETDGCEATIAAGCAVTEIARGRSLEEAMGVSPALLLDHLGGLPPDHIHCAILAATSFLNALANYLILNE